MKAPKAATAPLESTVSMLVPAARATDARMVSAVSAAALAAAAAAVALADSDAEAASKSSSSSWSAAAAAAEDAADAVSPPSPSGSTDTRRRRGGVGTRAARTLEMTSPGACGRPACAAHGRASINTARSVRGGAAANENEKIRLRQLYEQLKGKGSTRSEDAPATRQRAITGETG